SDVVANGISKASGVEHVLEHENLKPVNAMMFGDGPNDMEIFDYVGLKIAMGNAAPELKEKADYVTGTVEEDGIFNALEELGLVEKELHFPQLDLDAVEGPVATIKTNHGDLVIKLFPDHAPLTVTNFVNLAKSGYYDGVIFHRIIKDFMIQGGDPTGTGMGGESSFGGSFQDEFSEELYNLRGALSMANAGPDTNGSQFFIVQTPEIPYAKKELERGGWPAPIAEAYAENGGTPHLDRRHTVFGQLVDEDSYKVLDEIANIEVGAQDKPLEDVVIETVEVAD
ncbi:MAG: peptidylprolyl isomerase, partial [Streptococcus salivarius]